MKKKYLLIGSLVFLLLAAGAGAYWFFVHKATASEEGAITLEVSFSGEGTLARKEGGGWLFEYKETDGTTYAVPLFFSEISMCAWQETMGRCRPSTFVEGRKAQVEGIDLGGGIGTVKLTFIEAPPAH